MNVKGNDIRFSKDCNGSIFAELFYGYPDNEHGKYTNMDRA